MKEGLKISGPRYNWVFLLYLGPPAVVPTCCTAFQKFGLIPKSIENKDRHINFIKFLFNLRLFSRNLSNVI